MKSNSCRRWSWCNHPLRSATSSSPKGLDSEVFEALKIAAVAAVLAAVSIVVVDSAPAPVVDASI
jgi:RecA/RadA recombinase